MTFRFNSGAQIGQAYTRDLKNVRFISYTTDIHKQGKRFVYVYVCQLYADRIIRATFVIFHVCTLIN